MPNVKCNTIVLCDDVRQEKNDKYILLGVYPGPIGVQNFPASLVLSLFLVLEFDTNGQQEITIHVDSGANQHKIGVRLDILDCHVPLGIPTPKFPIVADGDSQIVVSIGMSEEPPEEAGRFSITHLAEVWEMFPSAPEQPSEQSETDVQDS